MATPGLRYTIVEDSRSGNTDGVRTALEAGEDPDQLSCEWAPQDEMRALHYAAYHGHTDIARLLLEAGTLFRIPTKHLSYLTFWEQSVYILYRCRPWPTSFRLLHAVTLRRVLSACWGCQGMRKVREKRSESWMCFMQASRSQSSCLGCLSSGRNSRALCQPQPNTQLKLQMKNSPNTPHKQELLEAGADPLEPDHDGVTPLDKVLKRFSCLAAALWV